MNEEFKPRVGGVLSADIAVPEHARMVKFYRQVLTTGDSPLWHGDLMNSRGMPIIGLGEESPAYGDLPLQWMPHIQVADVAQSVAQAEHLGGTVVMHAQDEEGQSQWAVLMDPSGAAFGLIPVPVLPEQGAHPPGPTGSIAWLDLTVADAEGIRDFYQAVIGWRVQTVAMEDRDGAYEDYAMLAADGKAAAGICHRRGVNQHLPSVWLLYLPVADIEESLRQARAAGGAVIHRAKSGGTCPTYGVIRDPIGVHFVVVKP